MRFDEFHEIECRAPHGLIEKGDRFDSSFKLAPFPIVKIFAPVNSIEANRGLINGREEIFASLESTFAAFRAGRKIFMYRSQPKKRVCFFVGTGGETQTSGSRKIAPFVQPLRRWRTSKLSSVPAAGGTKR